MNSHAGKEHLEKGKISVCPCFWPSDIYIHTAILCVKKRHSCLPVRLSVSLTQTHTQQFYAINLFKNIIPGQALLPVSVLIRLSVCLGPLPPPVSLSSKKKLILQLRTIDRVPFPGTLWLPLLFLYLFSITEVHWESFLPLHSSLLFPTPVNGSGERNPLGQDRVSDCSHSPSAPQQESSSFFPFKAVVSASHLGCVFFFFSFGVSVQGNMKN